MNCSGHYLRSKRGVLNKSSLFFFFAESGIPLLACNIFVLNHIALLESP